MHNGQFDFDDYGLTADTALALEAIGHERATLHKIRHALARHVDDYTTFKKQRFAGSIAKLLVVAQQTGGDPVDFGGVNLVRRLEQRVATAAPIAGRIEDRSSSDYANTIGQIFAVRGLLKAGSASGGPALRFLLKQQCHNGAFRLDFNADKTAAAQGCTKPGSADTDVTALAVIELTSLQSVRRTPGAGAEVGPALAAQAPGRQRQLRRRWADRGRQHQQHRAGRVGVHRHRAVRPGAAGRGLGAPAPGTRRCLRYAAGGRGRSDRATTMRP